MTAGVKEQLHTNYDVWKANGGTVLDGRVDADDNIPGKPNPAPYVVGSEKADKELESRGLDPAGGVRIVLEDGYSGVQSGLAAQNLFSESDAEGRSHRHVDAVVQIVWPGEQAYTENLQPGQRLVVLEVERLKEQGLTLHEALDETVEGLYRSVRADRNPSPAQQIGSRPTDAKLVAISNS